MEVVAMVDTSALIALVDDTDAHYARAREAYASSLARHDVLLVTNYVVSEALSLVQRRLGMKAVEAVAGGWLPTMSLAWVTPNDHDLALEALLTSRRRQVSFVDMVTFAVMRRLGVRRAFVFDQHFAEQGFEPLK